MNNSEKKIEKSSRSGLRKQIRLYAALTSLSVIITCITVTVSVVICRYYKSLSAQTEAFARKPLEKEDAPQAAEAISDAVIYTQKEADAMVTTAVNSAIDRADSELLQTLRGRLESGDSTMDVLRDLYPEHIVMVDAGQYYFLPRQEDLTFNTYVEENFVQEENGLVSYQEEGETLTKKGIDVSKYQGKIDWAAVKNDGIDYAIIRVGVRGYSEGAILEDEMFQKNIEGAIANGIPVGVYFFTQALNEAEAKEEAGFVIEKLQGYSLTYPVYLDVEDVKKANCRTNALTVEERTNNAKVFLEAVAAAGYQPALYGNMKTYLLMLNLASLEQYDKWFAGYTLPVYYPYEYKMLQYSENGKVAGIRGAVDVNICFKDYAGQE